MSGVVLWPQDGGEAAAGALVHDAQEILFRLRPAVPVFKHTDPAPISQYKRGNIDRLRARMSGKTRRPGYVPAGITPHRLDPRERAAQDLTRGTVDPELHPSRQLFRCRARYRSQIGEHELPVVSAQSRYADRASYCATGAIIAVG